MIPMTHEGFSDFIYAIEHSLSLRSKVKLCSNVQQLVNLANDYGFKVTINDLIEDENLGKIENWFEKSKINPIRRKKL